ncbi:hypothetical protein [Paracoccus sp. NSM]|uniref:hypothetical protein n=1 Tax=Paracoccus sp. NSM TaxID=3457784 RepID=UPI004036DDA6
MLASLRTDFDAVPDGARIRLHPADANFIHLAPVDAQRIGPDYRISDVAAFFRGYELIEVTA